MKPFVEILLSAIGREQASGRGTPPFRVPETFNVTPVELGRIGLGWRTGLDSSKWWFGLSDPFEIS
jgi:hypothetical protein